MNITKTPLQGLTKKEFNEAYEELLKEYEGKFDKYPLPTKEEILNIAVQSGEITPAKYMKLRN